MDYYIDFDNTLYRTSSLKNEMLHKIAQTISILKKVSYEKILSEASSLFNSKNIYNIYKLCDYFSLKYEVQNQILYDIIDNILYHGSKYVYKDVKMFLSKLKSDGNNLNLLTYSTIDNHEYQNKKILGSKLSQFFDNIIITIDKGNENIDYKNSIFIDDNPKDLLTLYNKNAKQVIRVKRKNNKYSKIDIDKNANIKVIKSLKAISKI